LTAFRDDINYLWSTILFHTSPSTFTPKSRLLLHKQDILPARERKGPHSPTNSKFYASELHVLQPGLWTVNPKQLNLTTYTTSTPSKELLAANLPLAQQPPQEDGNRRKGRHKKEQVLSFWKQ